MADKPNPLMPHGIIVIIVGAVLLAVGAWGTISTVMKQGALKGAMRGQSEMRQVQMLGSMPGQMAKPPTSLAGAMALQARGKQMIGMVKRFLGMGWMILLGGGMIAAGIFLLKRKNWARFVGFGGIAFAVTLFATWQGAAAHHQEAMLLPILLVVIVAAVAGKPLFDLITEKLEAA